MTTESHVAPKHGQPRLSVDIGKGRWSRVFHLFDTDNREIILDQKGAVYLAKSIIKVAEGK